MARGSVPLVSASLVLDAGEARVPAGRDGVAVLAGDALLGGTLRRSGTELAEALEGLGSGLRVSTGWDATTVTFTCVAERLEEMLDLLSDVVREPSFPPGEVQRMRNEQLASIRQRKLDPGRLADDALDRAVFPADHPFHRPLAGDEGTVSALDREGAAAFAEERYAPGAGGLVLVGDLSWDRVLDLAQRQFGEWASIGAAGPELPTVSTAGGRSIVIVHRPEAVQSEIRIGHPGPPRGHAHELALRVANTVLGGAFTSRLNLSLREKHGFTYGAHSSFEFRREGGVFSFGTAVQTEVTARALAEAMSVLEEFAAEGPTSEELSRARDYLAGVFPLRMETTAQLAARVSELIVFGLPDDYHHTYRDRIRAVEPDDTRAAVRAHLRPEAFRVVVVGDADRIAGEIGALGLGPVEVTSP
jgi:zinc protease